MSKPVGRHFGSGSMSGSDNGVVSSVRLVGNHMRLSDVALNGHFTSSGERHVDILGHLVQRLEKLFDVQIWQDPCLIGRLHVSKVPISQGHGEGVP